MKKEYRVVWQREGERRKTKRFSRLKIAERFVSLFGPEPWKAWGKTPDAFDCCDGRGCSCSGLTVKERSDERRAQMPKLEWIRIESRDVGEWAA